jgi:hypothetical protein
MNLKQTLQHTAFYQSINDFRWRERMTHPGNQYPDRTFYVIRRHANRAGLFSFYVTNLGSIAYAEQMGYVPVIDMQSSPNPMLAPGEVGKKNAWEDYFLQPKDYSLEDTRYARNVILGTIQPPEIYPDDGLLLKNDTQSIAYWRSIAHQSIRLKPELQKKAEEQYQLLSKGQRMLGILCRGTDYVQLRPKGHPVQPSAETVIRDAKDLLAIYSCDRIYLATEDKDIYEKFRSAFGDQVVSFQTRHYITTGGENLNDVANRKDLPVIRNMEYLISLVILSRCPCLLAGATSGSLGAVLMSDGFEHHKIYSLGRY